MQLEPVTTPEHVRQAADVLRAACPGFAPRATIVLGSGLGELASSIADPTFVPYEQVPHMAGSTAPGHAGCFVLGTLVGVPVVCMQGRLHAYEGHTADQIGFPLYVLRELGAQVLIATNAAGGIDPSFAVGSLMLITDHINLLGANPCAGPDQPQLRPRFFDMTQAYDAQLQAAARQAAAELGITLHEGVYVATLGPSFETPAEIRAFRTLGASAVGMSTVLETIAARSCGMRVLGISLISNPAAGVTGQPISPDDVNRAAAAAAGRMQALVERMVGGL